MIPVNLPVSGSRSRSSSNAASSSRERSVTLASISTAYTSGTMSTLTPPEPSLSSTNLSSVAASANGSAGLGIGGMPVAGAGGPNGIGMSGDRDRERGGMGGAPPSGGSLPSAPMPPVPSMAPTLSGALLHQPLTMATTTTMSLSSAPVTVTSSSSGVNTQSTVIDRAEVNRPLDMGDVLKYSGGSGRGVPSTGKETGQNPDSIYKTIQEASAKRISSLDYLKKTHEPRVFWFNTLLYTQPDIARLPSFSQPRLARRASNFLLLGVSLPSVVDLNTQSPTDYLRALNALMMEFEDYEKQHPSDGSATGSLSRARLPSMFKRSGTIGGKRRASSAADIGLPMQSSDPQELKNLLAQNGIPGASGAATNGANGVIPPLPTGGVPNPANSDVIPGGELAAGEDFSWLRTPSIPFDPDFFEVFVTLCDMLIECYSRITSLVSSPSVCAPEIGDIFQKTDSRIKKVVFEGIIKEFVEHTRAGVKHEVAGIGKIILGGLM